MKLSNKIPLTVFLLALVVLIGWGFLTVGDRFINTKDRVETKDKNTKTNQENQNATSIDSSDEIFTEDPIEEDEENVPEEEDTFVQVLPQDCSNECKNYQDPEDITYCKQICGLTEIKKEVNGCEALNDLEKDYCFKDMAISKTDSKICDKIEDAGIKKTCKNRIMEDIVDQQMLQ